MTEKLPSLFTQSSAPSQTVPHSPKLASTIPSHVSNKTATTGEEEPYTIKCICDFTDDDGNTIYCELCDTWQHIECYYPYNRVEVTRDDFNHSCVDCNPRVLDRERAKERQILRQTNGTHTEISERKTAKRPPPKGQKKKTRPTDLGLNNHNGPEHNLKQSHDLTHTHQHKKSKSTHRPSQSISSQAAKRSPSYGHKTTNPHGHPPSPATTPSDLPHEFEIHNYSSGFMDLYKEDQDVAIVQTNSFASLIISNILSSWLRDREKLRQEAGCDYEDVFQSLPPNIDDIKASPLVRSKELSVGSDTIAHWQYLISPQTVDKNVPLIELNGQIGIQKNYCEDPNNRWQDLSSPLPFVFFHPMLPLYIDTRREGSRARYIRRSCKSNAMLDTYLSGGSEYHFWLVSDRPIRANEQITIPWEFNLQKDVARRWLQLLGLNDDMDGQPEYSEKETETYQTIAAWVHTILSEYGGCACDLGPDCAFARFHRTYIARSHGKDKGSKPKKARKPKINGISPTSTGQATNSRAASEGHVEDGVDNDSASSRSKPPSRDMTPAPRQGSFDTLGVLTELTDRDKRKVQMVEDSFRRMEQQQPPRKKKRISDGTNSGASGTTTKSKSKTTSTSTTMVSSATEGRYVDAGTSGDTSTGGSPISAVSPTSANLFKQPDYRKSASLPPRNASQCPRPEYRDVAVQTDPVDGAWFSDDRPTQKPKRRIVSLSKRLLESRHRLRADDDSRRTSVATSPTSVASALVKMDLDSPTAEQMATPTPEIASVAVAVREPVIAEASEDTPMDDAPIASPPITQTSPLRPTTPKVKSPELRVQLPPVPPFNNSSMVSSVTTPVSATSSVAQSPFSASHLHGSITTPSVNGLAVQPSPKKKLSLSDYTKSRMNKAAAAAKSSVSLRPPTTIAEEARSPISTDTAVSESPVKDTSMEP